jgi:hypothetical protein
LLFTHNVLHTQLHGVGVLALTCLCWTASCAADTLSAASTHATYTNPQLQRYITFTTYGGLHHWQCSALWMRWAGAATEPAVP